MTPTPRRRWPVALLGLALVAGCDSEATSPGGTTDDTAAPSDASTNVEDGGTTEQDTSDTSPDAAHDVEAGDAIGTAPGMYNRRYCEVVAITLDMAEMTAHADVYNSVMFGTCPQAQWEVLDTATIAEQIGVDQVMLNGPRYFLMDSGDASTLAAGTVETFGEIVMRLLATLTFDLTEGMPTQGGYTLREVVRDNTWFFDAGREVYELVDADGNHYVMQSYSRIVDAELDLVDLPGLATRLTLPEGWSYQSRVLAEALNVTADGNAVVVQDDLTNTYQRYE